MKFSMKFQVGDLIRGTSPPRARYLITTNEMTLGEVRAVYPDGTISVIVREHMNRFSSGGSHRVDPKYFELAYPRDETGHLVMWR